MSGVLASRGRGRARRATAVSPRARIGVVGPRGPAIALGAAVALRAAAGAGSGVALLAGLRVDGPRAAPAAAAGRGADALAGRGVEGRASGRLVRASLGPAAPDAELERAAAVVDGPAVLVVDGVRTLALDAALGTCDRLVLVEGTADGSLCAEVAEWSLAALGPPVRRLSVRPGLLARGLALAGVAAVEPLRGAAELALGGERG